jgi:hypothetical protein
LTVVEFVPLTKTAAVPPDGIAVLVNVPTAPGPAATVSANVDEDAPTASTSGRVHVTV